MPGPYLMRTSFNAWEMDENAHLNVRGYFDRFDVASRVMRASDPELVGHTTSVLGRHVRYHAEQRSCAQSIEITSDLAAAPSGDAVIAHRMLLADTGQLSATGIDLLSTPAQDVDKREPLAQDTKPRGLSEGLATPPEDSARDLLDRGLQSYHSTLVSSADCDQDGFALDRVYIGVISDAAPHFWSAVSITSPWLAEHGCGRIAVEARVTYGAKARSGQVITAIGQVAHKTTKTITFRYDFYEVGTGVFLATGEVVGMIMDLTKRKVVTFPDSLHTTAERYMLKV